MLADQWILSWKRLKAYPCYHYFSLEWFHALKQGLVAFQWKVISSSFSSIFHKTLSCPCNSNPSLWILKYQYFSILIINITFRYVSFGKKWYTCYGCDNYDYFRTPRAYGIPIKKQQNIRYFIAKIELNVSHKFTIINVNIYPTLFLWLESGYTDNLIQ